MNKLSLKKGFVLLTTALFLVGGFFVAVPQALADTTTLNSNAAGSATFLSGNEGGTSHWDAASSDDDSYVYSSNTNYQLDLYNLPDQGLTGTINSVTVYMKVMATSADQDSAQTAIRTHNTNFLGTAILLPTSYTLYSTTYNINPNTNVGWTWEEVNALEAGVNMRKSTATGNTRSRATHVYVVVDYTPTLTNDIPVITLLGSTPVNLTVGDAYVDDGATASDTEDGDLTPSIVVGGTFVDTSTSGTFTVTYNVTDSDTNAAVEVVRTINVAAITTHTLTYTAGANGSIAGTSPQIVNESEDGTEVIAVADSGFHFVDWSDSVSTASRTDLDVSEDISVTASFARNSSGGSSGSRPRATPAIPATPGVSPAISTVPGQVLGAEKFIFTLFLKMEPPFNVEINGPEVMELQKFLNVAGFGPLVVDGKFGRKTKVALVKFQIANGLQGDGIVGPLTRAVLNK